MPSSSTESPVFVNSSVNSIYEWKEVFFSFNENPLPKASEPELKYIMNNIKTTEKCR
jgi:hypothetical protein